MVCVPKLSRFHGADDTWEYSLSLTEDGDEGTIGADMKLFPRGVGKWSLIGENHFACSLGVGAPLEASSSSSIMVLSDRLLVRTCAGGCGGGV